MELPSIDGLEMIMRHLERMGMANVGFDGLVGIPWTEVEAYCRLHFTFVPYWLPSLLHTLSTTYAMQSRKSTDPGCIAPYLLGGSDDTITSVRSNVHNSLKAFFK